MLEKFFPNFVFNKVEDISYNFLQKNKIKALIFDMDNTLVNKKHEFTNEIKSHINLLKKNKIKICILSNTPRIKTLKDVAKKLGIDCLGFARKPGIKGFDRATKLLEEPKENIAVVGDQLFTDVYGGNKFGIKTILVDAIEDKEFIGTKIKRPLERYVMKKFKERENKN